MQPTRVRHSAVVATLVGLGLVAVLVAAEDLDRVLQALAGSGPALALIAVYRSLPLALDAWAWNQLWPAPERRPLARITLHRWIGESVNTLLPVAQVGGDIVRARLASLPFRRGGTAMPGGGGGATTVVDFLFGQVSQVIFLALGIGCLVLVETVGGAGLEAALIGIVVAFALVLVLVVWGLQRNAIAQLTARLRARSPGLLHRFGHGAEAIDARVTQILLRRPDCARALAVKTLAWIVRAGEVWIAFALLGHPLDPLECLAFEAIAGAVRSAGFLIPGALGIQEGGIVGLGALLGMPPDIALAFALLRRGRELATSAPGLVVWGVVERGALTRLWRGGAEPETAPGAAGGDPGSG